MCDHAQIAQQMHSTRTSQVDTIRWNGAPEAWSFVQPLLRAAACGAAREARVKAIFEERSAGGAELREAEGTAPGERWSQVINIHPARGLRNARFRPRVWTFGRSFRDNSGLRFGVPRPLKVGSLRLACGRVVRFSTLRNLKKFRFQGDSIS